MPRTSATSLGSYLPTKGWKRHERTSPCAYETEPVKQPWKQNSGPRVDQASALLLSHSSDMNTIHRRAARGGPCGHINQEMEGQWQWTGQLPLPGVYYAPTTRWDLE